MDSLSLEIVTPKEVLAQVDRVDEVIIPALWGQMDILPGHTDFITMLEEGELSYRIGTQIESHNITSGVLSVKSGKATILVDGVLASVTPIESARAS
ncbi:MAG: hypothetical protein H7A33_02990 [Deltaproteobacteria bacterium]|nr:hypothetical protein [Deltaproteobacteria bacterium]